MGGKSVGEGVRTFLFVFFLLEYLSFCIFIAKFSVSFRTHATCSRMPSPVALIFRDVSLPWFSVAGKVRAETDMGLGSALSASRVLNFQPGCKFLVSRWSLKLSTFPFLGPRRQHQVKGNSVKTGANPNAQG